VGQIRDGKVEPGGGETKKKIVMTNLKLFAITK
jgi:hypothetical protein